MLIKIFQLLCLISVTAGMSPQEKAQLRLQVIDMFKHGFGSYMVDNLMIFFSIIYNLFHTEICLSC
jgi:hypothetical protein